MTASLSKISAGDGYDYLVRSVAVFDDTNLGRQRLADYYAQKGESPGRWLGRGLAGFGDAGAEFVVREGDVVREDQMRALFGSGRHPEADRLEQAAILAGLSKREALKASQLGRVFTDGSTGAFHDRLRQAYAAWNQEKGRKPGERIPDEVRAMIRTVLARTTFREAYGREPLSPQELDGHLKREMRGNGARSCAGFDVTFSPVKSISALWAVAPREVAEVIEQAQDEAVRDAVGWLEEQAAYTRRGVRGARQVETRGLIAAQFVHRDSRAGDPDLHTHVPISNKVQALEDGAWLALDGRMIYQLTVAASERYNSSMERILAERLGVNFVARASDSGRRAIREVEGISGELIEAWSSRRDAITQRQAELVAEFEARHLRPPTPVETTKLAQQATLETRGEKHEARSLGEQRQAWREQAVQVLGGGALLDDMVEQALGRRSVFHTVDDALVVRVAERVSQVVERQRAVWQMQHVLAEAERQVRVLGVAGGEYQGLVEQVVARVREQAVEVVVDPEAVVETPVEVRRRDGTSQYSRALSERFTTRRVLEAEEFIRSAAHARGGYTVGENHVSVALLESVANGVTLNPAQARLVREFATSGERIQLALAPAGTGKTTAMRVLARAWENGGGNVVAVSPTHVAADGLRTAMRAGGGTIAALTHALEQGSQVPEWAEQIDASSLVVVDEAGMAGTFDLAGLIAFSMDRGASVRLIGDHQQLAAVAAGGVLRDLAAENPVLTLDEVVRFSNPAEAAASLSLREGVADALGFYLDEGRLHSIATDSAHEVVVEAWRGDVAQGWDAVMITATNEDVAVLNRLAREHLVAEGVVRTDGQVWLRDGSQVGVGDVIVTRSNDRRLRVSNTDWVKNRQRWSVTKVHEDGSLRVRGQEHRLEVTLPAVYVRSFVELGYASTAHGAQGVTVDSSHTLVAGRETRQSLYVAMSRGRHSNHVWVTTGAAEESEIWMETLLPPTPVEVLEAMLQRDGAAVSATSQVRQAHEPQELLRHHAAAWQDNVLTGLMTAAGPEVCARVEEHVNEAIPGASEMRGWSELQAQMLAVELTGQDSAQVFDRLLASRSLKDARNPVAIMAWRFSRNEVNLRDGGPLPSLWGWPAQVELPQEWSSYLEARFELVKEASGGVRELAQGWVKDPGTAPRWARPLLTNPVLVTEVAVFRASVGLSDADITPLGPPAQFIGERVWQDDLRQRVDRQLQLATVAWQVPEQVRSDPYWPVLVARLRAQERSGANVQAMLNQAVQRGPLPTEHPAAALWWRVRGELHTVQGPSWDGALREVIDAAVVDEAAALPSWSRLAVVIRGVEADGHDPQLVVAAAATLLPHDLSGEALAPLLTQYIDEVLRPREEDIIDVLHDPDTDVDFESLSSTRPRRHQVEEAPEVATDEVEQRHVDRHHDGDATGDVHAIDQVEEPASTSGQPIWDTPQEEAVVAADDPVQVPETAAGVGRSRIMELNEQAAAFYRDCYQGSGAAAYLADRLGTDLRDQDSVVVGYAPAGNQLAQYLRDHGASDGELVEAGLAKWGRRGELIDVFRDRLMFGIHTSQGELVGFIGRAAPGADPRVPKYLNTPGTEVFTKGEVLFGLPEYQDLIEAGAEIVRVEGPMDALAITMATNGKAVGVAPLGTALTQAQANEIARHGRRVWEATDTDAAGMKAAADDFERYVAAGITAKQWVLLPPDKDTVVKDPAELLQHPRGRDLLQQPLQWGEVAPTLAGTLLRQLVEEHGPRLAHDGAVVRVGLAREAAHLIAQLPPAEWETHILLTAEEFSKANPQEDLAWNIDLITAETHDAAEMMQPRRVEDPYQDAPVAQQETTSRRQERREATREATREALQKARAILDRMNQKHQQQPVVEEKRSPNHPSHHDDAATLQRDDLHRRL